MVGHVEDPVITLLRSVACLRRRAAVCLVEQLLQCLAAWRPCTARAAAHRAQESCVLRRCVARAPPLAARAAGYPSRPCALPAAGAGS